MVLKWIETQLSQWTNQRDLKMNTDVKTEEEIRKQKKRELVNLVTELSREISRLDDMLDKVKSIVYNL